MHRHEIRFTGYPSNKEIGINSTVNILVALCVEFCIILTPVISMFTNESNLGYLQKDIK